MSAKVKPPFPYFGGKQRIADQLVQMFPEHDGYIEPYAGGLSVLLAKPVSSTEIINDLNSYLVTFWRVLRDNPNDLKQMCDLTPHARAEFDMSSSRAGLDDLEVARRVWVLMTQGRSAIWKNAGWRHYKGAPTGSGFAAYMNAYRDRLHPVAERIRDTQIECRPATEIIRTYGAHPQNLLYVDPPYMGSSRSNADRYLVEMRDEKQHQEMLDTLTACKAKVALSGYATPLYDQALAGWVRTEIGSRTQVRSRVEVLWTNYEPPLFLGFEMEDNS